MQPVSSNNSDQQVVIRVRPAKSAFDWFKQGFNLFNQNKLAWIGTTLAVYILMLALAIVPVVGQLIGNILVAGLYPLAFTAYHTQKFEHKKVFDGFKNSLVPMIVLTLVNMIGALFCYEVAANMTGFNSLSTPNIVDVYHLSLVLLILYAPILLAMLFAPALVILHQISPWQAIKMSFVGGFKNSMSMAVFGLVIIFAMVLAIMLGGLGLIFVLPIMHCTLYFAFQDIFHSRKPFKLEQSPDDEDSMYV
ncbi:transmembrane protein [Catenovulum agarivorans DS-2]|uniref:Transmembrane protein n=1 Tax=Catenovulum agarivorans DS-2 TaxID=1328313 RepID=W7QH11_9ALTE|nr:BPSS1780 family membrane protein [Catenovulum agarivorans]EWH12234.1 transmembrane protein [Catenovulum agarivorans DS-2]